MISKLLTGGIDLPKLEQRVIALDHDRLRACGLKSLVAPYASVADRLDAMDRVQATNTAQCQIRMNGLQDLIASRAPAEDVETLRLKVERVIFDTQRPNLMRLMDESADPDVHYPTLGTEVEHMQSAIASLRATVAGLQTQVASLTAAKLSEVKARKAPKKDAAK
jgi:hypothetical protein